MSAILAALTLALSVVSPPPIVDVLIVTAEDGTTTTNLIYLDGTVHGYVTVPGACTFDFYGGTETF